jgi:ribosomal protein S27AE
MILRILLIAIAFVILLRLLGWRPPFGRFSGSGIERAAVEEAQAADQKVDADLVICSHCGLSVSRMAAFSHAGRWACCIEHLNSRA